MEIPEQDYGLLNQEDVEQATTDEDTIGRIKVFDPNYASTAYIISYFLIIIAVITSIFAIIIGVLCYQKYKANSKKVVTSFPLLYNTCETSSLRWYVVASQLVLNVIGSILLASSNYLQQICTSPTISEILDEARAHRNVIFGSNSPVAMFRRKSNTRWVWISLVITSLPLHLLLNGITGYAIHSRTRVITEVYESQAGDSISEAKQWMDVQVQNASQCAETLLENRSIIKTFVKATIILKDNTQMDSVHEDSGFLPLYTSDQIDICFVVPTNSDCRMTVRWFPLICIAVSLDIKAIIVFFTLRRRRYFQVRRFNSLGDMIMLGARHPDIRRLFPHSVNIGVYKRRVSFWWKTLGWRDLIVIILWWSGIVVGIGFGVVDWLRVGKGLDSATRLERFGLGALDPSTSKVANGYGNAIYFPLFIIIANAPQVWASAAYLFWNNQLTRIWMEHDWRSYYQSSRLPRVSYASENKEVGIRKERFLQLPYWMTGMILGISTIFHFLVGQAFWVVEAYGWPNGPLRTYFLWSWSPLACMMAGTLAGIIVLGVSIYYLIPFRPSMPLMGGNANVVFCSCIALSADLPRGGIQWGDISSDRERLVGFGEKTGPLVEGITYPSNPY